MPPPILFQGDYLGEAIKNLGDTLLKAGESAYDKLHEAKVTSEFLNGQQLLANQVNQFNTDLSRDSDYDNYQDKWSKYKDQAWGTVTQTIKDPEAQNALNEWWNTQSIEQGRRVNEYAIQGTMGKLKADGTSRLENIINSPADLASKKELVDRELGAQVSMRLLSPEDALAAKSQFYTRMSDAEFTKQGMSVLQSTNNPIAFQKWVADPTQVPDVADMNKRVLLSKGIMEGYNAVKAAEKQQILEENGDLYNKSVRDVINGDLGPSGIAKLGFKGEQAGQKVQELTNFWESLHKDANAQNPGLGFGLALDAASDPTKNIQDLNAAAVKAFNNGDINKGQLSTIMEKIASGISESERAGIQSLNSGAKGTVNNPALYGPEDALSAQNMLQEAIKGKGKEASREYIQDQAEKIKKLFADKALTKAIDDQYTVQQKTGAEGVVQWLGITPKAGEPSKDDLSAIVHAWSNKEFEGTEGTTETAKIIGGATDQMRKSLAKKYNLDPASLKLAFDQDKNFVFKDAKGNQVRIVEKNGALKVELGKPNAQGGIDWNEDGSL